MFDCRVPLLLLGSTHGLPSTRMRPAGTFAATGGSGTTRAPVLISNLNTHPSRQPYTKDP